MGCRGTLWLKKRQYRRYMDKLVEQACSDDY